MAKIIIERDDGTIIIERDDGTRVTIREDFSGDFRNIFFADDYIAKKLWCREDVENQLREQGYEGNDEQIDAVINEGVDRHIEDLIKELGLIDRRAHDFLKEVIEDNDPKAWNLDLEEDADNDYVITW